MFRQLLVGNPNPSSKMKQLFRLSLADWLLGIHSCLIVISTRVKHSHLFFCFSHLFSSSKTSLNSVLPPQKRQPGSWTLPSQLATVASAPTPQKKSTGIPTCCSRYICISIAWKRQAKEGVSPVPTLLLPLTCSLVTTNNETLEQKQTVQILNSIRTYVLPITLHIW